MKNPFRHRTVRLIASTWLGAWSDTFMYLAAASARTPKQGRHEAPRWYRNGIEAEVKR